MDRLRKNIDWLSFLVVILVFVGWPELDLEVSGWFRSQGRWIGNDWAVATSVYGLFQYLPYFLVPLLLAGWLMSTLRFGIDRIRRPVFSFLLLTLLLGPGLLVHGIFKDGFERPRPRQVQEFGGKNDFIPAFVVADSTTGKGKSFVSGHAAMGFYLMALAWVSGRRRWLVAGILVGLGVSLVRVSQGGHFLSDTLIAGYLCYFLYRGLAWWLLGDSRIVRKGQA